MDVVQLLAQFACAVASELALEVGDALLVATNAGSTIITAKTQSLDYKCC